MSPYCFIFLIIILANASACSNNQFSLPVANRGELLPPSQCKKLTNTFKSHVLQVMPKVEPDDLDDALTFFRTKCETNQAEIYGEVRYPCEFLYNEEIDQEIEQQNTPKVYEYIYKDARSCQIGHLRTKTASLMIWLYFHEKKLTQDQLPKRYTNQYLISIFENPLLFNSEVKKLTTEWNLLIKEDISGITSDDIAINIQLLNIPRFFPAEGRVYNFYKEMKVN